NKNKSKLRGLLRLGEASSVVALAAELGVHRTTMYRWMRQKNALASAAPNKLLSWITEMRKNRSLCVSMQCLLLMHSRFDRELFASRSRGANIEFLRRFLKRSRLSIRRITHKGRKIRSDMEIMLVILLLLQSLVTHQYAIEECGALSYATGPSKYGSVFNMDQTAIYIDMNGKTTIDFVGTPTVDVRQGSEVNGFRCSVFLAASATGVKLPPLVVFAGIPGGPVSQDVWNPSFGHSSCEHTVQKKAFCNEAVMQEWIQRVHLKPSVDGCRLLLLDSLKVHKMNSVRTVLEEDCCTQVEFVPPGITGLAQPMDVAVMKPFKDYVRYLAYHIDHEFPKTPQEKRQLISRFVAEGWASISPATIRKGFAKSGILPTGPRDIEDRFRVPTYAEEEAPILEVDQEE
ncbi:DDE superfamily endonuclease, partial [Phytophthora infestans]